MQLFLSKIYSFFIDFISISRIKKILLKLKGYWQSADTTGKMLIIVFFTPSLLVLLWLLAEIAYIIVFELPYIIIRILAKILLFCIFWCAAAYFYEKLHCVLTDKTVDSEKTNETQNMEGSETGKERKVRWSGKKDLT
jgi:hypothetical protein